MFGLKINIEKTKKMMILPKQKILPKITPDNNLLEKIEVKHFKYLGVFLTNEVSLDTEVNARVKKASMAFGCLKKLVWYQPAIKYSTKYRLFKAVILPVLLFESESWAPLNHHLQRLNTFVNQCLQTILGFSLFDKIKNTQIRNCENIERIETLLRRKRLRWLGHVQKMENSRLPKQLVVSKIKDGKRLHGKQKQGGMMWLMRILKV